MNWCAFPARRTRHPLPSLWSLFLLLVLLAACGMPAENSSAETDTGIYELRYVLTPVPSSGKLRVQLVVGQSAHLLREIRFQFDAARYSGFQGRGELQVEDGALRWYVPDDGGTLSWEVNARNRRNDSGYDAYLGKDWGLMRAERVIPRAITRTRKGSSSETTLVFKLPDGWSAVTQYREREGEFRIDNPERRYDEPSGWMVMGNLGVRYDRAAGTRLVVAGPEDNGVRRLDILAFLNWTLPEVARLAPGVPERLTVVSAGDPMWRGGLSASQSLYLHAERPLLSENGTSTLLHEVLHVSFGLRAEAGFDWIVEGLAEFYTVTILSRSGGLSFSRTSKAFESIAKWGLESEVLCEDPSGGARTARAVTLFRALDDELRTASDDEYSLDDVLERLANYDDRIDLEVLVDASTAVLGQKPDTLHSEALPGCPTLPAPLPGTEP